MKFELDLAELRSDAIQYFFLMKEPDAWQFRFSDGCPHSLIASSVAGMLGGFLGITDELSCAQKAEWAEYLNSFQNSDGWFEDEDINDNNRLEWYGRDRALFHRTRHALCALDALDARPRYKFKMAEQWYGKGEMTQWLETLNLSDYWYASNMMMDAFLLLQHNYCFDGSKAAYHAILELLEFCDMATDPLTGYHDFGRSEVRNAMAGAMHLYPAYFIYGRKPLYPGRVIDTTLALQQPDGTFSYESGSGGEDCLDYDAVFILSNFNFLTADSNLELKASVIKCANAVMACSNDDGGFSCHRRHEVYNFGTESTMVRPGNSSLWATYSRLMTIGMAGEIFGRTPFNFNSNLMEICDSGITWRTEDRKSARNCRKRLDAMVMTA
ncbi:MAG: hypothetical protein L3J71_17835 [Victivallaceae bacterium]|nr:hypothetical protein [Victivallaceae bacterium]